MHYICKESDWVGSVMTEHDVPQDVAQNAQQYLTAKMQWFYIDELVSLGYAALRERSGKDETLTLSGPENSHYLMHVKIIKDYEVNDSVWVHVETQQCSNDNENEVSGQPPLHSGFTIFSSGKVEGHT